jgi:phage gpG-like protein
MPARDSRGRFVAGFGGINSSNIDHVVAFLEGFVDSIDFRRPGVEGSLGRDIMYRVAERMHNRALSDRRGIGEPWDKNEPKYAAWKAKNYGVEEPNSRTGQMLSQKSMRGRSTVEPKVVTMIYGTGDPPDNAVFGTPREKLLEQDKKVTDVQKAYFAHTGQSKHKILRPFYEVDESDGQAVTELIQKDVNDLIRETNALNGY